MSREVDALVTENVMDGVPLPYSSDIELAWKVVEKIHMQSDTDGHVILSISVSKELTGYRCEVTCDKAAYIRDADTAPLAICIAALATKGIVIKGDL